MTSWRIDPMDEPALREPRRPRIVRVIAVAVASLLMANGVILAEHYAHTDLAALLADGFRDARGALANAIDPEPEDQVLAGVENTTTTTGAAPASTPTTTPTTAPAATTETTAPAGPAPTAPPATAPPAAAVPAANSIADAIPALSAFVEKERGLKFKSPVAATVLDEAAFKAHLAERRLAPAEAEARQAQGMLKALGFIAPNVDLAAQVKRLSTGSATAFYDAATNELFVKAGSATAFARKILVHELTNALDDQHFELDRPALEGAVSEAGASFEAIAQGIAARVEERYVAALSSADKQSVETEQRRLAALIPRDIPQYVLVSFGFPFTAGLRMANTLASAGGQGRLNTALQAPPASTEQVLRPEKYTAGEAPRALPAPAADGAVVMQGSLGQLNLSLMLAEVLEAGYAEGAADGWGGDSYVAWQNGGQTCVRLAIDMDTAEENAELGEALADWAAERPGATLEGAGPFTVTRCA
ncbi:MAG: hypothetical protein ACRD0C_16010 [Acidimicrobiia bacterium]